MIDDLSVSACRAAVIGSIVVAAAILAILLLCSCSARRPGEDYPWIPVIRSQSIDGVSTTEMGVGRTF